MATVPAPPAVANRGGAKRHPARDLAFGRPGQGQHGEPARMILGLGSDIIDIRRIEKTIARHGDRFLERVFTEVERAKAMRRTEKIRAATFAKRFAAKEAAAKALGTGFRRGVFFADLGVVNLPGGQPTMAMTGGAAARLRAITPPGMVAQVALTMTDEYPYAYAQVIISAEPASGASAHSEVPWNAGPVSGVGSG
jgi:holo-[acyl-carrier protein] synthase